jgi:predicted enzyme related to lactoylglutathione lyase
MAARIVSERYQELLGIEPYFVRPEQGTPQYVEFRLGDYQHELGIIDKKFLPKPAKVSTGGAVAYWHVDDIAAALDRVKALGAKEYEPPIEREAGFKTASVIDPFGNVLGLSPGTQVNGSAGGETNTTPPWESSATTDEATPGLDPPKARARSHPARIR